MPLFGSQLEATQVYNYCSNCTKAGDVGLQTLWKTPTPSRYFQELANDLSPETIIWGCDVHVVPFQDHLGARYGLKRYRTLSYTLFLFPYGEKDYMYLWTVFIWGKLIGYNSGLHAGITIKIAMHPSPWGYLGQWIWRRTKMNWRKMKLSSRTARYAWNSYEYLI